jgi:protein-histidine N-methyltransferase
MLIFFKLGAGTALPSCLLLAHVLSRSDIQKETQPSTHIVLADYNYDVLVLATIPNLLLTWRCTQAPLDTWESTGELEISSGLVKEFKDALLERNVIITGISGAWSQKFVDLVPGNNVTTLILASETIYSPAALVAFTETLLALLKTSSRAYALVAAKRIYFGVGGGVDEFLRILNIHGGKADNAWSSGSAGLERMILRIAWS